MTQTHDQAFQRGPLDPTGGDSPETPEVSSNSAEDAPPRIKLEACLQPGSSDSRRLLILWFVKKSFWWMFFGGAALASFVHFVEHVDNEFQVNYRSPESVEHGLLSAWVFVVLAVLLRIAVAWVAVGLAFPLARAHEVDLAPRTGVNRHYATLSDRYKVAKAFRALRWTHHVRQLALDRVSPGPGWWRRVDPILDVVNVVGVVAFAIAAVTLATVSVADLAQ
ncbi:MAG: hypothetical protein ACR2PK_08425 [Acidimicrobiales bacterium]